jgi:hypothetical protein
MYRLLKDEVNSARVLTEAMKLFPHDQVHTCVVIVVITAIIARCSRTCTICNSSGLRAIPVLSLVGLVPHLQHLVATLHRRRCATSHHLAPRRSKCSHRWHRKAGAKTRYRRRDEQRPRVREDWPAAPTRLGARVPRPGTVASCA